MNDIRNMTFYETIKIDNPPPSPLPAGAQALEKGELILLPFLKGGGEGL